MDQLKQIVRVLVAQRFWVLSGVMTIVGLVCWYFSISTLEQETQAQIKKLNTAFTDSMAVENFNLHPNNFSDSSMEAVINNTKKSVTAAWAKKYAGQVAVLIWPPRLEDDFVASVKSKRSAESLEFPTPIDREINILLRERYRNYIKEVLPKLTEPIKAEWKPGAAGGVGVGMPAVPFRPEGGPGGKPAEEDKYIVDWNFQNQALIAARFDWSKQIQNVPTTMQIMYAQEDFWVLEHLMSIIAKTNGDVTARYKAPIKVIESIDLGAAYAQISGQVFRVPSTGAPVAGVAAPGEAPPGMAPPVMAPPGMEQGRVGGGMPAPGGLLLGAPGAILDPAEFRYVDNNLLPISAAKLRQAAVSNVTEEQFLKAAKRMPVRLRLSMDIRKLNRLLIECGNSNLPLEVRQVRINRGTGAAGVGMGGGAELPGRRMAPELAMRAMPGIEGGAARGPAVDPFATSIEIFGLVYIYNPPPLETVGPGPTNATVPPAATTGVAPAPGNATLSKN